MSVDLVDDLHAAEEFSGRAVAAAEDVLALTRSLEVNRAIEDALEATEGLDAVTRWRRARTALLAVVQGWSDYCRPGCGAEGDPASTDCDDDTCGCPCGHRED